MSSTGYGPRSNVKLQRLLFDRDETKYELWEARLLGYLQTIKLKKTILSSAPLEEEGDEAKNEESYAELIQLLDDTSLSLVMRDAASDGRKALKILRDHYASQGKPRIIALYTELTSLEKGTSETVTDYLIRAERSIMALKNAKETLSDGLVIAMILKGLPDSYKPFVVHISQSTSEITFAMFKPQLKSFEETEKFNCKPKTDQVMKTESPSFSASSYVTCYACGRKGHIMKDCPDKTKSETSKWCQNCMTSAALRQSTSKLYFWKRYFVDIKQRSVTQYYSVRHSLLKYSSAAGKRFYSSDGQRNTLAQVLMYNSVRRSLSVKYNSAAGNRFYSSGGQRNTLAHVLMYDSVRRSLLKYSSAAGKRFYSSRDSSGGQRNTLAQVSMCDSVRRSLFKYNSTVVKRFYPSGGQRNTLAQPMKLNETAAGGIITRSRG